MEAYQTVATPPSLEVRTVEGYQRTLLETRSRDFQRTLMAVEHRARM